MKAQFLNRLMSSFYLWVDHTILYKGEAFTNFGSKIYPIGNNFYNLHSYGLPFKQIVADSSIPNSTIMSGVYIDGIFHFTGSGGLVDINYDQGQVYFSSNKNSNVLSGNYSVKDFNIYLSNEPDWKIIFETRHIVQARTSRQLTGLAPESQVLPAIFISMANATNNPFAFGGMDTTEVPIRTIVFAENSFKLDAVCSILNDKIRTYVSIFDPSWFPFNNYGGFKSGIYNYTDVDNIATEKAFVSDVRVSHLSNASVIIPEIREFMPDVFPAIVDFKLETVRLPRA